MIPILLLSTVVAASPASDDLFPGDGRVAATVATGIPYLAIGEVAYGLGDRFALGVVAGVTPITYGVGLRARALLAEGAAGRLVIGMPLLYYPATRTLGHEPWVLAMPQLLAERPLGNGAKIHVGVGAALATCTGAIAAFFGGAHDHDDGPGFMGGAWNTLTVGGAIPMGASTRLFADAMLVMKGARLATADWIGGPPVVLTLGVRRGF